MENKYLKFEVDELHIVTFTHDYEGKLYKEYENEKNPSWGNQTVYDISHKDGFNKLSAAKGLHTKLEELSLKKGDSVLIKKITFKNKEGQFRQTFEVDRYLKTSDTTIEEKPITDVISNVASSMDANRPSEVKELSTDEKVNIMWDEFNKGKGKKPANPGDDLPF